MRQRANNMSAREIVEISPRVKPEVRVVTSSKRKKAKIRNISRTVQFMLMCITLVMLMCAVLYVQAQSIALSGEIDKQEETLLMLKSDNEFLTNELEMRTNLKDVEIYATTKLGLVKKDFNQIVYVQRENISDITCSEGFFVNLFKFSNENVLEFSEYISTLE